MPSLRIEHRTDKKRQEIWQWLESHIERELRHRVPREEFQIVESANNCSFSIKGKNVGAQILVEDNLLTITLDFPLLFVPFGPVIEAGIRDALKGL